MQCPAKVAHHIRAQVEVLGGRGGVLMDLVCRACVCVSVCVRDCVCRVCVCVCVCVF